MLQQAAMKIEDAERLWNLLPHPTDNHIVRLFARRSDDVRGDFARSPKEIKRFADSTRGMSTYVAPNPTTKTVGVRHNAEDVDHWSYFFFDVDPVCHCLPKIEGIDWEPCITCKGEADPVLALEETLIRFSGWAGQNLLKRRPTIIDSGRGYQAWLRTDDRLLLDEQEKEEIFDGPIKRKTARKAMGYWLNKTSERLGLIHGCKVDTSCSDLPRVMRLPGTVNLKTGRTSSILEVQDRPYFWLIPFLIGSLPANVLKEDPILATQKGLKWQMVFTKLTLTAQNYIQKGWEEPGRHKTSWHTAKMLAELGVDRSEARKALEVANAKRGEANMLSDKDLEHALDTAFGADFA